MTWFDNMVNDKTLAAMGKNLAYRLEHYNDSWPYAIDHNNKEFITKLTDGGFTWGSYGRMLKDTREQAKSITENATSSPPQLNSELGDKKGPLKPNPYHLELCCTWMAKNPNELKEMLKNSDLISRIANKQGRLPDKRRHITTREELGRDFHYDSFITRLALRLYEALTASKKITCYHYSALFLGKSTWHEETSRFFWQSMLIMCLENGSGPQEAVLTMLTAMEEYASEEGPFAQDESPSDSAEIINHYIERRKPSWAITSQEQAVIPIADDVVDASFSKILRDANVVNNSQQCSQELLEETKRIVSELRIDVRRTNPRIIANDDNPPDFSKQDIRDGYLLQCRSHPDDKKELDSIWDVTGKTLICILGGIALLAAGYFVIADNKVALSIPMGSLSCIFALVCFIGAIAFPIKHAIDVHRRNVALAPKIIFNPVHYCVQYMIEHQEQFSLLISGAENVVATEKNVLNRYFAGPTNTNNPVTHKELYEYILRRADPIWAQMLFTGIVSGIAVEDLIGGFCRAISLTPHEDLGTAPDFTVFSDTDVQTMLGLCPEPKLQLHALSSEQSQTSAAMQSLSAIV